MSQTGDSPVGSGGAPPTNSPPPGAAAIPADRATRVGGTLPVDGAASAHPLLVVFEPIGEGGDTAVSVARLALAAEAARLAAALGTQTRFVTWPAGPQVDFESLAAAVAAVAASAMPVAVLVQDGDTGRQLAPLDRPGDGDRRCGRLQRCDGLRPEPRPPRDGGGE